MKTKIITLTLCLTCFLFAQTITAQNSNKKTTATAPKHYPNPYDTPDPKRPIDKSPFDWEDYPSNLTTEKEMEDAYNKALKNHDGYKLLQITKVVYDGDYNYNGVLNSHKMTLEAFDIAANNKDPYLAYYATEFSSEYDITSALSSIKDIAAKTLDIALARKDTSILGKLSKLEEKRDLIDSISAKNIRKKALFINNKDYAPYPNPYDNPQTDKPLVRSPLIWTDFPADINNDTKLTAGYNLALQNHDGYRLLQLAKVEFDHNYSSKLTPETILKKAYDIAQYNKDPYLLLHITVFEKHANVLNGIEPVEIFEKTYNTAIERKDSEALSLVYTYESINNFSPNINGKNIKEKMNEFTKVEPLR